MATVTHMQALATTTAGPQTTAAFTPAAGDLLVVFALASGSVDATPTLTSSAGTTFTRILSALGGTATDTFYFFVANATSTAVSQTVTFNTPNDVNTGCIVFVAAVSGMSLTGSAAVRQSASLGFQGATTPSTAFPAAALTGNVCLGCVMNVTNPATLTPPASWTEGADVGYITPTEGGEYAFRNSGHTSATVTWGNASPSNFGVMIIELDATVTAVVLPRLTMPPMVNR